MVFGLENIFVKQTSILVSPEMYLVKCMLVFMLPINFVETGNFILFMQTPFVSQQSQLFTASWISCGIEFASELCRSDSSV